MPARLVRAVRYVSERTVEYTDLRNQPALALPHISARACTASKLAHKA